MKIRDKTQNLERLKAQRNELNSKVRLMREELTQLHEPGSYIGEVVKPMGKQKILVKINPDGKYVVDIEKDIENKIIRTPLEPDITFFDDPLRILRAIRFASRFNFSIEEKTLLNNLLHYA